MGKKLTLTIDNGPTPGVTEHVLDVLRDHAVPATFFVLGQNIADGKADDLLARMQREGHRIGNHTYSHSVLFGAEADQAKVLAEIDRTQEALGAFGAEKLFRPYGGGGVLDRRVMSRTAFDHLSERGYTMPLWNSIPGDWLDPTGWPATAIDHIREHDWTVMVIHDLPTGAMDRLGDFIAMARAEVVEFRADFPADLVPLAAGQQRLPVDDILSDL